MWPTISRNIQAGWTRSCRWQAKMQPKPSERPSTQWTPSKPPKSSWLAPSKRNQTLSSSYWRSSLWHLESIWSSADSQWYIAIEFVLRSCDLRKEGYSALNPMRGGLFCWGFDHHYEVCGMACRAEDSLSQLGLIERGLVVVFFADLAWFFRFEIYGRTGREELAILGFFQAFVSQVPSCALNK